MIKCLESDGANGTQLAVTAIGDLNEHETNSGMAGTTGERGECNHPAGGLLRHHASVPPNCSPRTPTNKEAILAKIPTATLIQPFTTIGMGPAVASMPALSGAVADLLAPSDYGFFRRSMHQQPGHNTLMTIPPQQLLHRIHAGGCLGQCASSVLQSRDVGMEHGP